MGTTMVLARLLTPDDYGLVAMAFTLTVVLDQLRTMGLSQAIIQRENLTLDQVNVLFYINVAGGLALAAVTAVSAPLVAAFYGYDELVPIMLALSVTYVLSSLGVQAQALLTRQMKFRALALRDTAATFLVSGCSIAAALAGAGYWALVVQYVASPLFTVILVWVAVSWRPGRPRNARAALPLVKFGAGMTLGTFFNSFARMADSILVGRLLGAEALGLYSRAYNLQKTLMEQLKMPLQGTMTPLLSALQREPDRYRRLYTGAVAGMATVAMPLIVVLAICSEEVIGVVLGDQWGAAAPIFQWLAVGGLIMLLASSTTWLFYSTGRGAAFAKWSAFAGAAQIGAYAIGLRWGVVGVAAAFAVSEAIAAPLAAYYATRGTPVAVRHVAGALARPAVISAAVLAVSLGTHQLLDAVEAPIITLVLVGSAAAVIWALMLAVWPSARREAMEFVQIARPRRPAHESASGGDGGSVAGSGGTVG